MGELVITTTDKDLLADINAAAIDGVVVNKPKIRKVSAIITTAPDPSLVSSLIDIGVNFAGGVSATLFTTWLNDRLSKKKPEQTKINGVEVFGKNEDVKTEISKSIGCNHRSRKKNKKK